METYVIDMKVARRRIKRTYMIPITA